MSNKVELDMTVAEAQLMWCQFVRARAIGKTAIATQNFPMLAEAWAWNDCLLDQLSRTAPEETNPTGNESGKP